MISFLLILRVILLTSLACAMYVCKCTTKWPDPVNGLAYVDNPVEAGFPGHWLPINIIKRIMETRVHTLIPKLDKYIKVTQVNSKKLLLSLPIKKKQKKEEHLINMQSTKLTSKVSSTSAISTKILKTKQPPELGETFSETDFVDTSIITDVITTTTKEKFEKADIPSSTNILTSKIVSESSKSLNNISGDLTNNDVLAVNANENQIITSPSLSESETTILSVTSTLKPSGIIPFTTKYVTDERRTTPHSEVFLTGKIALSSISTEHTIESISTKATILSTTATTSKPEFSNFTTKCTTKTTEATSSTTESTTIKTKVSTSTTDSSTNRTEVSMSTTDSTTNRSKVSINTTESTMPTTKTSTSITNSADYATEPITNTAEPTTIATSGTTESTTTSTTTVVTTTTSPATTTTTDTGNPFY